MSTKNSRIMKILRNANISANSSNASDLSWASGMSDKDKSLENRTLDNKGLDGSSCYEGTGYVEKDACELKNKNFIVPEDLNKERSENFNCSVDDEFDQVFDDEDADPTFSIDLEYSACDNENLSRNDSLSSRTSKNILLEDVERHENLITQNPSSLNVASSGTSTKKHFCCFCETLQTKFARHLELKHNSENEVKLFLSMEKKSSGRIKIISDIRKRGDFIYNSNSEKNQGEIIVVRRPQMLKNRNASDFIPCGNCCAMYSRYTLAAHYRNCNEQKEKFKKDILVCSRRKMFINPKANYIMKNKIIPPMRQNAINETVRTEELIILFGNRLTQKYRSPHLYKMIRARLRCVANFYLCFRKFESKISNLESVFDPVHYDTVVKAVNDMAGLNEETGIYRAPATASSICTYIRKITLYLICEMIKRRNLVRLEEVKNFQQLIDEGFAYDIYKTVNENQLEMKRKKRYKLPSTRDINKLKNYLDKEIETYYEKLNRIFSLESWKELMSALLTNLQVFNRRRAGEIERIKIKDFWQYEEFDSNDENYSQSQEIDASSYVRILIRGKRGRGVPVLVDKSKLEALKLIIKYRSKANVSMKNPYVFGLPGGDGMRHLEANRLMNKYAHLCGADNPQNLKGTQLRKHFATKCGTMQLSDVDLKDIANYMGHEERIHMEHYRLPTAQRDLRISRLLEQASGKNDSSCTQYVTPTSSINSNTILQENMGIEEDKTFRTPMINKRISWSEWEKKVVEEKAKFYFENLESPTLEFCSDLVNTEPALKRRRPYVLKAFIMNTIRNRKQKVLSSSEKTKYITGNKKFWTEAEKSVVFEVFKENLESGRLPSLALCEKAISENAPLENRNPKVLKAFIYNFIKKKKMIN